MADIFTKEKRSEIMSHIRSKNTAAELEVFRFLRREGIYFQRHYKRASGNPDVALPKRKIAVFIDGDFWHGRRPSGMLRLSDDWRRKIEGNVLRDKKNRQSLRRDGWKVLRIWVSDLEHVRTKCRELERVKTFLSHR